MNGGKLAFRQSEVFQGLFQTYQDVADFLIEYAFTNGYLARTERVAGRKQFIDYEITLLNVGNPEKCTDVMSAEDKASLVSGGFTGTAAIRAVWGSFCNQETKEFGPIGRSSKPDAGDAADGWLWEMPPED